MTAALLLLGGASAWYAFAPAPGETSSELRFAKDTIEILTIGGPRKLEVEVAETPDQLAHGLMFRTSLPDGKGMLFLHKEARNVRMWMRNTFIPLDMVFIRPDGTIHRIEVRTEPHSEHLIESEGAVAGVLEIAGGAADRLGLKKGDRVVHPHFSGPKP